MDLRWQRESTAARPALKLAFELGEFGWTLGFTTNPAQRARRRQVPAGDIGRVLAEIAAAKRRFQLPEDASVTSCYEVGREGFWLHRCLEAHGVRNLVVDSSSIEVKRRARRTKTDRLDLDLESTRPSSNVQSVIVAGTRGRSRTRHRPTACAVHVA